MNRMFMFGVFAATAAVLLASCSEYEGKGNAAYDKAAKVEGNQKRQAQKEAYIYFQKAIQENKKDLTKVKPRLRNRFLEMTLNRAEMVLSEGTASNDAIDLYMSQDIDPVLNDQVDPKLRDRYASFIVTLADSMFAMGKLNDGFQLVAKAASVAGDKARFNSVRDSVVGDRATNFLDNAKSELGGEVEKCEDPTKLVRAEFFTLAALLYNKDMPEAKDLLTKLYAKNLGTFSAYRSVFVDDLPDTTIFRAVNKYYFFMAILDKNGDLPTKVNLFNYTANPQRLRALNFTLVDDKGTEYAAIECKAPPEAEILDQKKVAEVTLKFPPVSGKVQKLVFKGDDGALGEKCYY